MSISEEASQVHQAVLEALQEGPVELEVLLARFPWPQRNQVLLAIDSLSRRSAVHLQRPAAGGYVIAPC